MSSESKSNRPTSRYELVMVAAREARRLTEKYTRRGITPPKKITMEALDRVEQGEVEYEYEDDNRKSNGEERQPPWNP